LPALRGHNGGRPKTHRCGTLAMRVLRFFLMPRSPADCRRAQRRPAGSCVWSSPFHLPATFNDPFSSGFSVISIVFQPSYPNQPFSSPVTSAWGSSKAAFISHSQRPPQTPAASF
jgi:hypothetical protein